MCQMLIRPPEWLKAAIQTEARRVGVTINALALQILCSWADSNGLSPTSPSTGPTPPPAPPPVG